MSENERKVKPKYQICPIKCPYMKDRLNGFCGFCMRKILQNKENGKPKNEPV